MNIWEKTLKILNYKDKIFWKWAKPVKIDDFNSDEEKKVKEQEEKRKRK